MTIVYVAEEPRCVPDMRGEYGQLPGDLLLKCEGKTLPNMYIFSKDLLVSILKEKCVLVLSVWSYLYMIVRSCIG